MIFSLLLALISAEECLNDEGVGHCKQYCNEDLLSCQKSCDTSDLNCMAQCNRLLLECQDKCPCGSSCPSGCPCLNEFCSTWQVNITGYGVVCLGVAQMFKSVQLLLLLHCSSAYSDNNSNVVLSDVYVELNSTTFHPTVF